MTESFAAAAVGPSPLLRAEILAAPARGPETVDLTLEEPARGPPRLLILAAAAAALYYAARRLGPQLSGLVRNLF
eukprot:tig00000443_g771.t1